MGEPQVLGRSHPDRGLRRRNGLGRLQGQLGQHEGTGELPEESRAYSINLDL